MNEEFLALGVLWYVVFLFSTTCHEAGHALAAKLGGDLTAFHGGQVSLDPMPHIRREPFGMVLFPIISYIAGGWMMGWASAPYDPYWAQRHPRRAAWMALAGPAANMVLVAIAAISIRIGIAVGFFKYPETVSFVGIVDPAGPGAAGAIATLLSLIFSLNLLLGTFNLIPVPPLDGFSAIGLLMGENQARRLEEWGQGIRAWSFLGLLIAWQLYGSVYAPVFFASLRLLYAG
jgi:Zn-dependent protease